MKIKDTKDDRNLSNRQILWMKRNDMCLSNISINNRLQIGSLPKLLLSSASYATGGFAENDDIGALDDDVDFYTHIRMSLGSNTSMDLRIASSEVPA
jgi:hypothetical protein